MKVTVAICTSNRSRLLRQTLSSLLEMEIPATVDWELVLVDNGSTDDTAGVIRDFSDQLPIRYLHEPIPGHSRCRNRAIEVAEGDLILWTDDDVIVSKNWLADYVHAAREFPQFSFFGSQIIPQFEAPIPTWLKETWSKCHPAFAAKDFGGPTRPLTPGEYPFGANFAIRTAVQRQYPFDVHLGRSGQGMLGDDEINVLQRLKGAGHRGIWLSAAAISHVIPPERATVDYLSRYFAGQGTANVIKRKPTTSSRWDARWAWLHHLACYRLKRGRTSADEWVSHLIQSSIARGELQGWKWIDRHSDVSVGLPRILIATDVPFWRRETGAHQRIAHLIRFLQQRQFSVQTAFLGSLKSIEPDSLSADGPDGPPDDRQLISQQGFRVWSILDDWKPSHWLERLGWQTRCLWHGIKSSCSGFFPDKNRNPVDKTTTQPTRRLPDFVSPEFFRRFQKYLTRERPDVVLVEYVTLSYLVKPHPRPESPQYWIDTHDLLSVRKEQFEAFGHQHWLDIGLQEEADCLRKFDKILAIQAQEARQMRELTDQQIEVLVVGHALDSTDSTDPELTPGDPAPCHHHTNDNRPAAVVPVVNLLNKLCPPITENSVVKIGYLASLNAANAQALEWFLNEVWPPLIAQCRVPISLIVAGGICRNLTNHEIPRRVHLLDPVPSVPDFYQEIDIVINPIQFGSGLKIKTVEGLTFGKPLVATRHGALGLEDQLGLPSPLAATAGKGTPLAVADCASEMTEILIELAENPELRLELGRNAADFAKNFLSPDFVYRDLLKSLLESKVDR